MSLRTVSDRTTITASSSTTESVILLEQVSVAYRVPHEPIGTLKEYAIRRLQGRVRHNEFWGLRDVNLSVSLGEIFGVMGRNGAGKTTLLKVVARVLRPSLGRVRVRGHVAPLLELGAGFHPELTGRENVFLNGALLGHSQREIAARLTEILEFAEVGEFIDAPLRTYSSGMSARLGFAVATAWQPDILILDELLAVGDETFQRKCLARLESFRANGTTVLLVSHNAEMIKAICQRAVWLDRGIVKACGRPDEVVEQYRGS
jgi:ABC-type polysaccharide/polyol phosphate transport system ATPase subunit